MTPLAEILRPQSLDEYIGQQHLIGPGAVLRTLIESGNIPSMIFWGPPGIGKTQLVHQLAASVAKATGKQSHVRTVSLVLQNPVDLRGIPAKVEVEVINEKGEKVTEERAKWLKPELFELDPSDGVINWVFLDEIPSAAPSVQAAAYQIALERRIGEHEFPKNTVVIGAGNRTTDRAVAFKMPKPLANRATHFEVAADAKSWHEWALTHGIHQSIIAFIEWNPEYLFKFDPTTDDVAFPTPRSWELVNSYLKTGQDYARSLGTGVVDAMFECIAGTVGLGVALEYKAYTEVYGRIPTFKDIITGKTPTCPKDITTKDTSAIYAIVSMLASNVISYEKAKKDDLDLNEAGDLLNKVGSFINSLPSKEFQVLAVKDVLIGCTALKPLIIKSPKFKSLFSEIGKYVIPS